MVWLVSVISWWHGGGDGTMKWLLKSKVEIDEMLAVVVWR